MAPLKQKGDHAELEVACDLRRRGFRIALPYGEDWDFDLIFQRPGCDALERVQVKHAKSQNGVVAIRCYSHSLTKGRIRQTKYYTATMVDWIAAYDPVSDRCYYVPSGYLGAGRSILHLRVVPARNSQRVGIHDAENFLDPELPTQLPLSDESEVPTAERLEPAGLEPAASGLQSRRSSN